MYVLELFAGAGGGILGSILCGHTCIGAVEADEYCRDVLFARQRDGILPEFPIWDDVRTFRRDNPDTRPFIEWLRSIRHELIISGGFPCQDISVAGKGAGLDADRSGLWWEMARIIGEVEPQAVFLENSPAITFRGGLRVVGALAEMGYNAQWGVVGADDAGAPHRRKRWWCVADADKNPDRKRGADWATSIGQNDIYEQTLGDPRNRVVIVQLGQSISWWDIDPANIPDADRVREPQQERAERDEWRRTSNTREEKRAEWSVESRLGRVAHGVARRVDRLKAIGNGQVPAVVAIAWNLLTITEER